MGFYTISLCSIILSSLLLLSQCEMDVSKLQVTCHSHYKSKNSSHIENIIAECRTSYKDHGFGCIDACILTTSMIIYPSDIGGGYGWNSEASLSDSLLEVFYHDFTQDGKHTTDENPGAIQLGARIEKHCRENHDMEFPNSSITGDGCKLWEPITKCVLDVFNCVLE